MALIGPNGTGKTTLLRILAGDLAASDGAVTRSGGLGVMRQFIGKVRDDTTVRDLLVSVAPDPVRRAALEVDRTELAMMERETEQDQLDYAQALADWGDVGRLRVGDPLGRLHRGGAGHAVRAGPVAPGLDAVRRRAEARGARGAAARPRGGAAARRAGQLPRRAHQALAGAAARRVAQDGAVRQPRPRAARPGGHPHRDPRAEPRRATPCGFIPGGSRPTSRPGPSATTGSTSSAAAGTRSSPRSRHSSSCTGRRPPTTTGWRRGCRPPRPGCASSRRPGRPRRCRCARRWPCGSPGGAPPSARWWRAGSSCGSTAAS